MDVCVCLFCVCAALCVQVSALRQADPPSKGTYWLCIGLRNWKSGQGPTKGSRAIDLRPVLLRPGYARSSQQNGDNELGRVWKDAVVVSIELLSQNLSWRIEKPAKNVCQCSRSEGRVLNPGAPECEAKCSSVECGIRFTHKV
jgi:hypothetical protein